jgi:hypothetical protein
MRKQFGLFVPISIFILILVSCSGTNSTPPAPDTTKVIAKNTMNAVAGQRYKLTGYLDILWMRVDSFQKLDDRVTFRFYIKNEDTLTLHGWSGNGKKFKNRPPNVILLNGPVSDSAEFGPKNYFGNLQLSRRDVRIINHVIDTSKSKPPKSVLFIPLKASNNAGQITYDIVLTDDPAPLTKTSLFTVSKVLASTNPSPPRNGN